jgi:hypothetical protein
MQNGMIHHLPNWILHYMNMHKRLDMYNAIYLSVPAYHDLTQNNKSYEEVSQRKEKEMMEMSLNLLRVLTRYLQGEIPFQRPIFNHLIECTPALLEFYLYARYETHDDATLRFIEDTIRQFHTFKDGSLIGRVGKMAKAKANALG